MQKSLMAMKKRNNELAVVVLLLIILAALCGYKGYKAGYRNGLIHASLQFQLHFLEEHQVKCN
jgi:predicted negative regulator of RcsB-dependent stress response